jgi:hypothetical protein
VRRGTPSDSYRDATNGVADIALYPFVFNQTTDATGPLVSVPYRKRQPHIRVRAEDLNVSIFIDPFDVGGWRLVLVLLTLDDGSHIHRCPWAPVATPTAVVAVSSVPRNYQTKWA